jgi:hypothetical protein
MYICTKLRSSCLSITNPKEGMKKTIDKGVVLDQVSDLPKLERREVRRLAAI